MRLTGLICEHNGKGFPPLVDMLGSEVQNETFRQRLISYLKSCTTIYSILDLDMLGKPSDTYIYDGEEAVCLIGYASDGVWVWPFYFAHYLEKYPNLRLETEFVKHVVEQDLVPNQLSIEEIRRMKGELKKLGIDIW